MLAVKDNIFQIKLAKLRQRTAMNMIKRNLLIWVRHQCRFYEWRDRMEAEGAADMRLMQMKEEERLNEIERLKEIELQRLRQ